MMNAINVEIPQEFSAYISAAVIRLSYLFPECEFVVSGNVISFIPCASYSVSEISSEVMHQIYRERIYSETLSIRRWLSNE